MFVRLLGQGGALAEGAGVLAGILDQGGKEGGACCGE
jgi:hypothetical protein